MLNIPVCSNELLEHYIVRLAKWLSYHPACILNISDKRGSIEKGKFADLIVWDPWNKYLVDNSYEYAENSPFVGHELLGRIQAVYLRGNIAWNTQKNFVIGKELIPS